MKHVSWKVALTAALTSLTISASAANPFVDVEPSSWAYQAVTTLSQQGLVEGYPDGMFRGEKNITRYEMAQIIGRLTTKKEQMNQEQQALVSRLATEYADELATLGARVDTLEKKVGNTELLMEVRTSGMNRYENVYRDHKQSHYELGTRVRLNTMSHVSERAFVYGQMQTYLSMNGEPMYDVNGNNEDGKLSMNRLFATYYFGKKGIYDNSPFGPLGNIFVIGQFPVKMGVTGYTYDGQFKGIALKIGDSFRRGQLTLAYGRATDINYDYTAPMMRGISGLTEPIVSDIAKKFKKLGITQEQLTGLANQSATVYEFSDKLVAMGAHQLGISEEAFQQKFGSQLQSITALGDKFEIHNNGGTLYPLAPDVHMRDGADKDVPAVYASYVYKQPDKYEFHLYGLRAVGPVSRIVKAAGFAGSVNLNKDWNVHGEYVKNFRTLPLNNEKPYSYSYGLTYGNMNILKPKSFSFGIDYVYSQAGTYFGGSSSDVADQYMGHVYHNWSFLGKDLGKMPAYIADKLTAVEAQTDSPQKNYGGAKFYLASARYVPMKGLLLEASYGFGAKDMGGQKMDPILRLQATAYIK